MIEYEVELTKDLRRYRISINGIPFYFSRLNNLKKDLDILKYLLKTKKLELMDDRKEGIFNFKEGNTQYLKVRSI